MPQRMRENPRNGQSYILMMDEKPEAGKAAEFLAICARIPGNALISAECEALTGSKPASDGVALCHDIERIRGAAFVMRGLRVLARANTLEELAETIAERDIRTEEFQIEVLQLASQRISGRQAILAIANALHGFPNLDAPKQRFMALVRNDGLYFGEIVIESDQSYKPHSAKPYHMSSSLSSQMARALVNLVAPPARSVLDPCCGTGSILLEAHCLGLEAYGCDINPRMVGMTQKNLAYFRYKPQVQLLDARLCQQKTEALVTDLPYGRFQIKEEINVRGILERCAYLAPVAVFAAGEDLSNWLSDSGYSDIEIYPVVKSVAFKRFIHRAQSKVFDPTGGRISQLNLT